MATEASAAAPMANGTAADDDGTVIPESALVPEGEAVVYEEELLVNPYSMKLWLRYLQVLSARALCGARCWRLLVCAAVDMFIVFLSMSRNVNRGQCQARTRP